MEKLFKNANEELRNLILMRQSPNEGYSSDQMDELIKNKIIEVSDLKYAEWNKNSEMGKMINGYKLGMTDMYNLMLEYIITPEP